MAELPKPPHRFRNEPSERKANILLVDDKPANLLALRAILDDPGHNIVEAHSGDEALERILSDEFAVVLLDVNMPGISGFETAKLIRGRNRSRHVPIIFLTANDIDRSQIEEGYTLGAVDFLVKPLMPVVLKAKVRGFVEIVQDKQRARREAEQLRLLVQGTTEYAIFMLDPEGYVLTWNAGAQRLKGYKAEEIIGQHFSRFYPQDALDRAWPKHELEMARTERRFEDEGWRLRKDGTQFWANVVITALRDEAGNLGGFSKITRDMTAQKKAEESARRLVEESAARRAAEEKAQLIEKQRLVLESITDAFFAVDRDWRFTYVNPQAERLLDRKPGDLLGALIWEVYPGLVGSEVEQAYRRVATERITVSLTSYYPDHDRWYEIHVYPATDGISIYFQDVSERKRAEAEVARLTQASDQQRRVYETALSNTADFNYVFDLQGRFAYVNKPLLSLWQKELSEAVGKDFFDLEYPHDLATRLQKQIQEVIATKQPVTDETPYTSAVGERLYEYIFVPVLGASGEVEAVAGSTRDITERKRGEEALREAERRWRNLAEALPNLVWTDLPNGQCDYLSSQWGTYTGIPENELLGLAWLERVIHPDDRERTAALWHAACDDKAVYDLEYRIRRHDGQFRWFKTRGVPIRNEKGQIVQWFGTCTDIEDQKQAHHALAQSEERFRQLADAMPQIVWTARADGNIDYMNRRWQELTDLPATLGNEGWAQILHPDDAPAANDRWANSLESGAPFEMEVKLLDRRKQAYRWHLIRTVAALDGSGKVTRWFGTSTDIHEQKRAEESSRYLAEASAALAKVVDYESTLQKVAKLAVPYFADWSAVDVANEDGSLRRLAVAHQDRDKIRLVHELMRLYPPDPESPGGALAVLRSGQPEIVGEITDEMLVQGARDERHLNLIRALGLKSYICVPLTVSGEAFGVLTFATAESGRIYYAADLALAQDLAHRAAIAVENTRLYQALRDNDRRKDEFLATLAHELRNPLAPIRNSLQILKMPRIDAATAQESREMMERQVHHLVRLVDDLLDVSRVMRGKIELRREPVELATIVARAVETAKPLIEVQRHRLDISVSPESLLLDADPVRLAQVVGNLLTNSAKYTESNGHIWLSARRVGDQAVLTIRDTGIGIAPHMLPHVFELFVQADHASTKAQGGLGIGLTLVKNLVEMHGGSVRAHSAGLGKGCEFVIHLPLQAEERTESSDKENGPQAQKALLSGHRLLVVDDNKDAAMSLATLLRLQGHEVRIADDGLSALEMATSYHPDLVFLDIGMPRMDGYEVARRMRQMPGLEKTVLAALTGWGQQEDRRRTAKAGFDHHLVKPVETAALENLLAGLKRPDDR